MKKTLLAVALALVLTGCAVGPKEEPRETLASPEATLPATLPTEETTAETALGLVTTVVETSAPETEASEPSETFSEAEEPDDDEPAEIGDIEIEPVDVETLYATISLNVRSGPSTDYESIGHLDVGEGAEIVGYNYDSGWYLIKYGGGNGWVSGKYMAERVDTEQAELPDGLSQDLAKKISDSYNGPGTAHIYGYYGSCDSGVAVAICGSDTYTEDVKTVVVGDYEFELASGSFDLYFYSNGGMLMEINDAYSQGILTDSDFGQLDCKKITDEQTELPDGLSQDLANKISDSYNGPGTAHIYGYYGSCDSGVAVAVCGSDTYTDDVKTVAVGDYEFELASGSFDLYFYSYGGALMKINDAYFNGFVLDSDFEQLDCKKISYPQLDPLDHAMEATICGDYAKYKGISADKVEVRSYYGKVKNGYAVVMYDGRELIEIVRSFYVGDYMFEQTGDLVIEIRTDDGSFTELTEAYNSGLVSNDDLRMIYYYSSLRP